MIFKIIHDAPIFSTKKIRTSFDLDIFVKINKTFSKSRNYEMTYLFFVFLVLIYPIQSGFIKIVFTP